MDFKTAFGQKVSRLALWRRFEQWTESTVAIGLIQRDWRGPTPWSSLGTFGMPHRFELLDRRN